MGPNSFGKKLGIGVRVAGRIARDRAAEAGQRSQTQQVDANTTSSETAHPSPPSASADLGSFKERGRTFGQGLGRGTKNFGQHFFSPLAHAGGVLWLEITGCFFALFALFFGQNIYMLRANYAAGPLHRKFVLYAVLTVLFVYFSGSSFLKARLKTRKRRNAR